MQLTSKISLSSFNRNLKALLPDIRKEFLKRISRALPSLIKKSILSGISPVGGQGRFEKYSPSYLKAIKSGYVGHGKTPRPVNLKVTGDLLKAINGRVKKDRLEIYLKHELAIIHNSKGAGKSKVLRRILPTEKGEKFSTALMSYLKKEVIKAAKKVISRRFPKRH